MKTIAFGDRRIERRSDPEVIALRDLARDRVMQAHPATDLITPAAAGYTVATRPAWWTLSGALIPDTGVSIIMVWRWRRLIDHQAFTATVRRLNRARQPVT